MEDGVLTLLRGVVSVELKVRYLGGHRFETSTSHHRLTSDQSLEPDSANSGATPPELFLFSLASCAGYYAAEYLNARALPSEELEIYVSARKGERPPRFTSIALDVIAPGLNKHHRDGILRAAGVVSDIQHSDPPSQP